jgi:hypothetical protein
MQELFPFLLGLCVKLAASAAAVVLASLAAERSGPVGAALIASLPVSAGPAYILLALAHDSQFIAHSAHASLVGLPATAAFVVVYAVLARCAGLVVSLVAAFVCWAGIAFILQRLSLTPAAALLLNSCSFLIAALTTRHLRHVEVSPGRRSRWWDLPARGVLAAMLVGLTLFVGQAFGPAAAGLAAVFPLTMTSLVLILHVRLGWPVSVATLVNTLVGMIGFGMALWVIAVSSHRFNSFGALSLGLTASICWNAALLFQRRNSLRLRPRVEFDATQCRM